jgi:hypothetical protein
LEFSSPSRRIFIGSHSLPPPLWFAVSVLQRSGLQVPEVLIEERANIMVKAESVHMIAIRRPLPRS